MTETTQPRPRRKPGALRSEIVASARELFLENGYAGASMRQIADRTGTTQGMLYRYFPGKAAVFEAAVLEPFTELLAEYVTSWRARTLAELPTEALFADFNRRILAFAGEHRQELLVLLAADAFEADELRSGREAFAAVIAEIVEQVLADAPGRGWDGVDLEVATRATIAMVVGTALLEPWMYGPDAPLPATDRVIAELTAYELAATTTRSAGPR